MNMVTSSKGKPLMPTLDDTDLACLVALQAEPRVLARAGAATGIAERTVARRLKRLMDADALRVIAEPTRWSPVAAWCCMPGCVAGGCRTWPKGWRRWTAASWR